jgi:hypothetical protein
LSETVAQVCRAPAVWSLNVALIAGHVTLADSVARQPLSVEAEWRLHDPALARSPLQNAAIKRDAELDVRGRFILCGLPLDEPIRLRLSMGLLHADTTMVLTRNIIHQLEWSPPWRR